MSARRIMPRGWSFSRRFWLGALLCLGLPLGCERREKPTSISAGAPAAALPTPSASAPLPVAFAYIGPIGDGGWTFAHERGRRGVDAAFPGQVVSSFVENVPEAADAERVMLDLVSRGNRVIFGTTFGYMEQMLRVAREHPDVYFEHATGYKLAANLRTYNTRTYEGAYLAGVVAGKMTESNVLGIVGSIPIPEVIRNIDTFTLGATSVNPAVKTKVVWVSKWFDPPKEAEAAQALLDQGADVLLQNTDSPAVLQTAAKNGRYAFGWDSNMQAYAPEAHLGSVEINWSPYYVKAVKDVLEHSWKSEAFLGGMREGCIDLVSVSEKVPAAVKAQLEKLRTGMKDGSFAPWTGPISDSTGKEVLKAGERATDAFLLEINFYVAGVEGSPPS